MSHYARNHLQEDWASHAASETAERIGAAERMAAWNFDQATWRQRKDYEAGLDALRDISGPARDHACDILRRRFAEATAEARGLFERTVRCLLDSGEVSQELDEAWTALCEREPVPASE